MDANVPLISHGHPNVKIQFEHLENPIFTKKSQGNHWESQAILNTSH